MSVAIVLGILAVVAAGAIGLPPSRELMIKLATMLEWAARQDPARYAAELEPISPFVGRQFKHSRLKGVLRTDMSAYGEICERLQREARRLDVKAHYGLIPIGVYMAGLGVWRMLQP